MIKYIDYRQAKSKQLTLQPRLPAINNKQSRSSLRGREEEQKPHQPVSIILPRLSTHTGGEITPREMFVLNSETGKQKKDYSKKQHQHRVRIFDSFKHRAPSLEDSTALADKDTLQGSQAAQLRKVMRGAARQQLQKLRILTDVTMEENTSKRQRLLHLSPQTSLLKMFKKKKPTNVVSAKKSSSLISNHKEGIVSYNNRSKSKQKKLQQSREHSQERLMSPNSPIAVSAHLFSEIQTTLNKRPGQVIIAPQITEMSKIHTKRLLALEKKLKRISVNEDNFVSKTQQTDTTADDDTLPLRNRSESPLGSCWKHVTIEPSSRNIVVTQSNFNQQVRRLQEYADKNDSLIQKYIFHRQDLIETVFNMQINQHLRQKTG